MNFIKRLWNKIWRTKKPEPQPAFRPMCFGGFDVIISINGKVQGSAQVFTCEVLDDVRASLKLVIRDRSIYDELCAPCTIVVVGMPEFGEDGIGLTLKDAVMNRYVSGAAIDDTVVTEQFDFIARRENFSAWGPVNLVTRAQA